MTDNLPTILTEMSEIEGLMGNTSSEYWRGENSAGLQARYVELAGKKQGATQPTILAETDEVPVAIYGRSEFAAVHGSDAGYSDYVKVASSAADIVMHLSKSDRAAVTSSFEALPDHAVTEMLRELLQTRPPVSWASEEITAKFMALDVGVIMADEWGGNTRKSLAVVRERIFRILENLDEAGMDAVVRWLDDLPTAAYCAICRKLTQ